MIVETVRIVAPVSDDNPLGFVVINRADFAQGEMESFVDGDAVKDMTVALLREALTAKAVTIPDGAKKADLVALFEAAQAV